MKKLVERPCRIPSTEDLARMLEAVAGYAPGYAKGICGEVYVEIFQRIPRGFSEGSS